MKELEKPATKSQGHHTIDHLEKGGRRKRQWSTIDIQSMADGTTVNRTSELLPIQHYRPSETPGGAHMDIPEHFTIFSK